MLDQHQGGKMLSIAGPPPATTLHISIEKIVIPEGKELRFDISDERNARFIENLDKVGLLEPICVRPLGDEFELVYGRRRLWGAKELKWEFIEAIVAEYSDDEIKFITIVENVDRAQLTAVQELGLLKDLNEEHERIFGPNPGRKISGRARAAVAFRDPVTKKFISGRMPPSQRARIDDPDEPNGVLASASATTTDGFIGSDAGSETAGEVETENRSYVELAAGPLAKSPAQTRADRTLARAFTKEQLSALGACKQISKRALGKLAKIKNTDRRAEAVALVCSGKPVAEAVRQAIGETAGMEYAAKARAEENLSDEAWVAVNCEKLLPQLQDPTDFKRAATLFRETLAARSACRAKIRKLVEQTHNEGSNPYTWHLMGFLCMGHPGTWLPCGNCQGLNKDAPTCTVCRGTGFQMRIEWPKR
jgi:hypothetical protein